MKLIEILRFKILGNGILRIRMELNQKSKTLTSQKNRKNVKVAQKWGQKESKMGVEAAATFLRLPLRLSVFLSKISQSLRKDKNKFPNL